MATLVRQTVAHLNSPRAPLSLGPGLRLVWWQLLLLGVFVGGVFHLNHGGLVRVDQKHVKTKVSFSLSFFLLRVHVVCNHVIEGPI